MLEILFHVKELTITISVNMVSARNEDFLSFFLFPYLLLLLFFGQDKSCCTINLLYWTSCLVKYLQHSHCTYFLLMTKVQLEEHVTYWTAIQFPSHRLKKKKEKKSSVWNPKRIVVRFKVHFIGCRGFSFMPYLVHLGSEDVCILDWATRISLCQIFSGSCDLSGGLWWRRRGKERREEKIWEGKEFFFCVVVYFFWGGNGLIRSVSECLS